MNGHARARDVAREHRTVEPLLEPAAGAKRPTPSAFPPGLAGGSASYAVSHSSPKEGAARWPATQKPSIRP